MGIVWRWEVPSTVRKPLEGSANRKARVGSVRFRGGPRSLWRRCDLGRLAKIAKFTKIHGDFFSVQRCELLDGPMAVGAVWVRCRSSRTPHHSHPCSLRTGVGCATRTAARGTPETPAEVQIGRHRNHNRPEPSMVRETPSCRLRSELKARANDPFKDGVRTHEALYTVASPLVAAHARAGNLRTDDANFTSCVGGDRDEAGKRKGADTITVCDARCNTKTAWPLPWGEKGAEVVAHALVTNVLRERWPGRQGCGSR